MQLFAYRANVAKIQTSEKGFGLVARRNFAVDEIVFQEFPLFAQQLITNEVSYYRHFLHRSGSDNGVTRKVELLVVIIASVRFVLHLNPSLDMYQRISYPE